MTCVRTPQPNRQQTEEAAEHGHGEHRNGGERNAELGKAFEKKFSTFFKKKFVLKMNQKVDVLVSKRSSVALHLRQCQGDRE